MDTCGGRNCLTQVSLYIVSETYLNVMSDGAWWTCDALFNFSFAIFGSDPGIGPATELTLDGG